MIIEKERSPEWWHQFGKEVHVKFRPAPQTTLALTSGSCHIQIYKCRSPDKYDIRTKIYGEDKAKSENYRTFTTKELLCAFALVGLDHVPNSDLAVTNGVDAIKPGYFVRKGSFLNIPCMGTGGSGDPNASIFLHDPIKKAVSDLVKMHVLLIE